MKSWEKRSLGSKTEGEEGLEVGALMAILKGRARHQWGKARWEGVLLLGRQWPSQMGFPEAFFEMLSEVNGRSLKSIKSEEEIPQVGMRGMCRKAAGLERKAGWHLGGFERLEKADWGLETRGDGKRWVH